MCAFMRFNSQTFIFLFLIFNLSLGDIRFVKVIVEFILTVVVVVVIPGGDFFFLIISLNQIWLVHQMFLI